MIFCDLYTQVFQAIMVVMKLFWLAALACFVALGASNPQLLQVQSVYILPMGSGMDQFLANRLARFAKMQVVSDPQHADAVLTDRLGEPFEKKLDELYPPPRWRRMLMTKMRAP